jgi:hypothetical protein
MIATRLIGLALACVMATAPAAAAQSVVPGRGGYTETPLVQVSMSRDRVSTGLGESFGFSTRIENTGTATLSGLVAHLNVVGLSSGIYVDPEDWSEERTKSVASLGPGESADLSWDVTAVTGGEAAIYVAVLPGVSPAGAPLFVSPAMDVRIAAAKDFNTDGVLPLALCVPALLALATLAVRRRRSG